MAIETIIFDPDGDVLLCLLHKRKVSENETCDMPARPNSANGTVEPILTPTTEDSTSPTSVLPYTLESVGEVHMLVSSRHMMLASPVFKLMLQRDKFKEGETLHSTGRVEIPLPDDDPVAMKILLDIIHGHVRRIPRIVSLNLMTDLAILVDKYSMLEVTELILDKWIDNMNETLPRFMTPDLLHWLCISWVFRRPAYFKHITKIAQHQGCGNLGGLEGDLPIPMRILETIENNRQRAIHDALSMIEGRVKDLQSPNGICRFNEYSKSWNPWRPEYSRRRFACDGLMLGSLLKSATEERLWPIPDAPYNEWSVQEITVTIRCLNIQTLCEHDIDTEGELEEHRRTHKITSLFKQMEYIEAQLSGLALEDYQ